MKGRKRHIVVDVMGCVLSCHVSAANVADSKAAVVVLTAVLELYARIAKVLADQSYRGELGTWAKTTYECEVEISERPMVSADQAEKRTFVPEKFRWVVERTFSWLEQSRALCRDYERLPKNHEAMVYVVNIRLMLRRLTKNQRKWDKQDAQSEA